MPLPPCLKPGAFAAYLVIIFTLLGALIGHLVPVQKNALFIILGIAALWGMSSQAIWGLVTLGELLLGYFVYTAFIKKKPDDTGATGAEISKNSKDDT